jgi:hypothetical protein
MITRMHVVRVVGLFSIAAMLVMACGSGGAGSSSGSTNDAKTPSGGKASCASDSDCAVTDHTGCCSCCPEAAHSIPKTALEEENTKCLKADCAPCSKKVECPKVTTPPIASLVAKCEKGTCAAVTK